MLSNWIYCVSSEVMIGKFPSIQSDYRLNIQSLDTHTHNTTPTDCLKYLIFHSVLCINTIILIGYDTTDKQENSCSNLHQLDIKVQLQTISRTTAEHYICAKYFALGTELNWY